MLYPHQIQVLKETEGFKNVAYYLDMGLGKTFVGTEKMKAFGNRLNLIICQKSKVDDWVAHCRAHMDEAMVIDLTIPNQYSVFKHYAKDDPQVWVGVINYELAWRREELLTLRDFTLMLDESSKIQNRLAKQTKFIMKLKPKNVILLSGTPCSGKYENLTAQIKLLGWDISTKLYEAQYTNQKLIRCGDGRRHKVIDKEHPYKNVERLKDKLRQHGAVFMKTEEVLTLPEKNFIPIHVDKPKEYDKFRRDKIVDIPPHQLVGDTILKERLCLRQICGIYNSAKADAFKDILDSTNERVLVFYNFNDERELLREICHHEGRPYSMVSGGYKDLTAYEEEDNSVTLIQYQAGAMGLNLQKANLIVYWSPTDKCELWMQSQKRIHRIGQDRPCFYYQLITKGSIECRIYDALERGVDYTDELFREEYKGENA